MTVIALQIPQLCGSLENQSECVSWPGGGPVPDLATRGWRWDGVRGGPRTPTSARKRWLEGWTDLTWYPTLPGIFRGPPRACAREDLATMPLRGRGIHGYSTEVDPQKFRVITGMPYPSPTFGCRYTKGLPVRDLTKPGRSWCGCE